MKFVSLIVLFVFCSAAFGQLNGPEFRKQDPDSLRAELSDLFVELSIKHPGFYRYNEKVQFDNFIDSTINSIQGQIDELEILRKVKPLIAKIGCLHTGIHLSDESNEVLNSYSNCLPFTLYYLNEKAVVWKSFSESSPIKEGDIVNKINGRDIQDIYSILLKNIPMDGYNQTGKYRLLQYSFPEWYRNIIEEAKEFEIELSDGKKITIDAIDKSETFDYSKVVNQAISLKIIHGVAIITIPSFSNSYLKSKGQKFKKEIRLIFKNIEKQGIEMILFDLRRNTGGSDSNPAWLSSYFFKKAYRYWDRIEVTQSIAEDITGLKRLFYGKAKYENKRYLWSDKGLFSKEFKYTNIQKPKRSGVSAKVYILSDGLCMSSCADFIAIMQANNKAIIIGEESGGGYQGNTSGLIPSEKLQCGLIIEVPLLKYVNSVPVDKNFGRGSIPDIEMKMSLHEVIDENAYLERIIEAINTQN